MQPKQYPQYRKKPVVIEAVLFDGTSEGSEVVAAFLGGHHAENHWFDSDTRAGVTIHTLEGDMRAEPGDWIVRGVVGEFYPIKPGVFEATYEPVEE